MDSSSLSFFKCENAKYPIFFFSFPSLLILASLHFECSADESPQRALRCVVPLGEDDEQAYAQRQLL